MKNAEAFSFDIIEPTEPFSSIHVKAAPPFNADATKSAVLRVFHLFPIVNPSQLSFQIFSVVLINKTRSFNLKVGAGVSIY